MKIANKNFWWYVDIVKWPFFFLVVWHILALFLGVLGIPLLWLGSLVAIGAYMYVGYLTVKRYKGEYVHAAWAGVVLAVTLALLMLLFVMLSLLFSFSILGSYFLFSPLGMSGMMGKSMMMMGYGSAFMSFVLLPVLLVGMVIGSIFAAIVGALLSLIGAVLAKNVK